ncbi:hypothetical protein [Streptomyces virginiae]|uniref:Uncharacterized protein n=1 Tax=Streptomyces virginiae TaxID=1961 RepID=A0ABZ1TI48_STRVG|nr:hypothetical protein [Streptomyces virginiae]
MTNRFEYTDEFGQRLAITPVEREQPDDAPALWFTTTDGGWGGTSVKVPLDKLEELIAGQRDMARQAGGQPVPQPVRIQLDGADAKAFADALRHGLRGSGPEGA